MIDLAYFPNVGCMVKPALCGFDASLSVAGLVTIGLVLLGLVATYSWLIKTTKKPWRSMALMGTGVLLFELFTAPMWENRNLGRYTYIYNDLSLVMSLGWIAVFHLSVLSVNRYFGNVGKGRRFLLYLIPVSVVSIISENLLVRFGIRAYAPEVWQTSVGTLGLIPVEALYYAPVFSALVLSFYFSWDKATKHNLQAAFSRGHILKTVLILAVGITMYELLIEPLVESPGFPIWSYFYQDISFLRIGLWIGMLFVGMWLGNLVIRGWVKPSRLTVFWAYVLSSSVVFYLVEVVLFTTQSRAYTESVTQNFTGLTTPILNTPVEIVLAIVMYNVLIVSFLRLWSSAGLSMRSAK